MKTSVLASSLFVLLASACSSGSSSLPEKSDLAGKSDLDSSALCVAADLAEDCDLCEEMGWYGDGVCDTFCEKHDPDCGSEIPASITAQFAGGALPPVHPELGVYAIYKPGVFPVVAHYGTGAELLAEPSVSWALEPVTCSVQVGESTYDACSEDEAQPTGCFLGEEGEYNPITSVQRLLEENDLVTATPAEKAAAAAIEGKIEFVVTAESAGVEFYYGMVDGKLYLLAVDVASLDCSA